LRCAKRGNYTISLYSEGLWAFPLLIAGLLQIQNYVIFLAKSSSVPNPQRQTNLFLLWVMFRYRPGPYITGIRPQPIMLKILPIMLLSIAQKSNLLCSKSSPLCWKLSFQNQDYAWEPIVLLEYMSIYRLLY